MQETAIPAATPQSPQAGVIRLIWSGKPTEGRKVVNATFNTQLPGASASPVELTTEFNVVAPLEIYSRQLQNKKLDLGEISVGRPESTAEIFILSRTRPELKISMNIDLLGGSRDCINWTAPTRMSESDAAALGKEIFGPADLNPPLCAYRSTLTVC